MNAFMLSNKLAKIYRDIGFEVMKPRKSTGDYRTSWMFIVKGPHVEEDMPLVTWGAVFVDEKTLEVSTQGSRGEDLHSVLGTIAK